MLERIQNVLRNRKAEGDKGFSLIELAIVVVIIGILVAIAIPVFTSLQGNAEANANQANASNGAAVVAAYLANNGGSATNAEVKAELDKMKVNGVSVTATLTPAATVTLDDFCVTVGGKKAGPCPA